MQSLNKKGPFLIIIVSLLFIFTACSSSTEDDNQTAENENTSPNDDTETNENETVTEGIPEPVTLKVGMSVDEETFETAYKKPIEDHFPNLTVELAPISPDAASIEEALMAGNMPDIIQGDNLEQLTLYDDYEFLFDHTDLIEKYDFDLDLFNHSFIQAIKSYADGEELWALPKDMTRYALHYNKDIFDQFGVDYPEDDMTWEDIIALSRKVTGERNGQTYAGLQVPVPRILLSTLSTPLVDPETDEPLFTTEPVFTNLFKLYEDVYRGQNTEPDLQAVDQFIGDQTLAMMPIYYLNSDWTGLKDATEQGMNWDVATFPTWDETEPITPMVGGIWLSVTDFSTHKEAAFQAIKFWLSEDEIGTILESPMSLPYTSDITSEFVEAVELDEDTEDAGVIKDKNNAALFAHPTLDQQPKRSKYETVVYPVLVEKIEAFIDPEEGAEQDINTVLRELQEAATIAIDEAKKKE